MRRLLEDKLRQDLEILKELRAKQRIQPTLWKRAQTAIDNLEETLRWIEGKRVPILLSRTIQTFRDMMYLQYGKVETSFDLSSWVLEDRLIGWVLVLNCEVPVNHAGKTGECSVKFEAFLGSKWIYCTVDPKRGEIYSGKSLRQAFKAALKVVEGKT